MILQGGQVVDEWGDVDKKIDVYSVRKTLLSALYGIYSAEGVIDISQTLEQLGIDDSPNPLTEEEKQARVVDPLRARSGVYHLVDFETESVTKNRPPRREPSPRDVLVLQQLGLQCLGNGFREENWVVEDRRGVL